MVTSLHIFFFKNNYIILDLIFTLFHFCALFCFIFRQLIQVFGFITASGIENK